MFVKVKSAIDVSIIEIKDDSMLENHYDLHLYDSENEAENVYRTGINLSGLTILFHHRDTNINWPHLTLEYIPKTNIMLFAGQDSSRIINLATGQDENIFPHVLFWAFELHDNYILEQGELDCLIRNFKGEILDRCRVEPPYEVVIEENKIIFKNDGLLGETSLDLTKIK